MLLACDPGPSNPTIALPSGTSVWEVTRGDLQETLLLTGALDAASSVEFTVPRTDNWNISLRWMAEDGARVKAGDRVVEFDNASVLERLGELELAVIEAAVELDAEQAKIAVEVADEKFEVRTQEVAMAKAELDATVPEELQSRREFQDARLELQRAKVALTAAREDLKAARDGGKLQTEVKRLAFQKALRNYETSEQQLDALVLTAPRDGVFVVGDHPWEGRKVQIGDNVWPGFTVGKLPDLSAMIVDARLSDVDDGRVHPGMPVTCTVDAFADRSISGHITAINPVAHEAGKESLRRFFSVVVELDETDPSLRPGMSVKVEVVTRSVQDAVLAPRAALDLSADPVTAHREDGSVVPVQIAFCNARQCVIESGLQPGDRLRGSEVRG